jgi:hypothetical protein
MKKFSWFLSFLIMASVVAFPASSQFNIMGGYSKISSTENFQNELWSGGYYVSGLGLIQVAKGLHVGLWGAYHRWGINYSYFQEYIDISISGSASNIQIFPCLRYEFLKTGTFRPYIHVGAGLSIMNAKADVSSLGYEIFSADESRTGFGSNFGIGVRILTSKSMSIEALALLNLYFKEGGGTTNWLSLGIGLNFGR